MGKVLLVVDDSMTIRTAVELIFEGTEYRIVAKETGEAGLAWMRAHTPDLILVDERMPDMDGYDFGSRIKANGKNEELPILLLACQDGPDETKADTADLDGYVNKPFGSQELVTLVEMLTGSSISQMPLSFKDQLAQRQREREERRARLARGQEIDQKTNEDELSSLESALASVSREERQPLKKDEPVVEIPVVENPVPIAPIRLESRPLDLFKQKTPEPARFPPPPNNHVGEKADPSGERATPDPGRKIPHADLIEPPPSRFPPPAPIPDLPLPPRRDTPLLRRPRPEPIALRPGSTPPSRPPPPRAPPLLSPIQVRQKPPEMPVKPPEAMVNIEAPVVSGIAESAGHLAPPVAREEAVKKPEIPIEAPSTRSDITRLERWVDRVLPAPSPELPLSSRGILYALLAVAVILGLVAFYFVSQ